jgi:hypothetical protein
MAKAGRHRVIHAAPRPEIAPSPWSLFSQGQQRRGLPDRIPSVGADPIYAVDKISHEKLGIPLKVLET